MRVLAILIALAALGCEDRYGTYITVRATTKDQAFDTLDLYFGIAVDSVVPTTPKHPEVDPQVPQLSFRRAFAPSDHRELGAREPSFTVWIPDGGENNDLGDYVLAVASAEGQQVGAGELFDFHVTDQDKVVIYDLPLHDYDASSFEPWGRPVEDCLRYERDRGPDLPRAVAIVRGDDSDCDSFPNASDDGIADCEPMLYCDGTGTGPCVGREVCLHDSNNACSVGECINADNRSQSCEEKICVADELCAACDPTLPPAELLACTLVDVTTHPSEDLQVPVRGNGTLCRDPTAMIITLPFACNEPNIAGVGYSQAGPPFDFRIAAGPNANQCTIDIQARQVTDPLTAVPHLLVTLGVPPTIAFVVGLKASAPGACPPNGEDILRDYMPKLGRCAPPDL